MPANTNHRLSEGICSLSIAGEEVLLLAEPALFWPREEMLVVADLHLGKSATLRRDSLPIPTGTTSDNLARLESALVRTSARKLLFLGDLIHSRSSREDRVMSSILDWRRRFTDIEIMLIRGNHDRHAGDPPSSWDFISLDEPWRSDPFCFWHHPNEDPELYSISGHLHPAVRLLGGGRQSERLPCFVFGTTRAILPAFGALTGCHTFKPASSDQVFVFSGENVVQVN